MIFSKSASLKYHGATNHDSSNIPSWLRLCTLMLALGCSGCISLLPNPGPRPKQMVLSPELKTHQSSFFSTNAKKQSIAVSRPTAGSRNESNRISISHISDGILVTDHLAGVTFHDDLPELVQSDLIRFLQEQGKQDQNQVLAVGMTTHSFYRSHVLETHINDFEIHIDADKRITATVSMTATLLQSKGRKAIWQGMFTSTKPIKAHNLVAFKAGLESAYTDVLEQITLKIVGNNGNQGTQPKAQQKRNLVSNQTNNKANHQENHKPEHNPIQPTQESRIAFKTKKIPANNETQERRFASGKAPLF